MTSEWHVDSLASVAVIVSGKRPQLVSKEPTPTCIVPVIGGGGPSGFTDKALYDGHILITGRVGTLGKLFAPTGPCWPSDNALVIRPRNSGTDVDFLRYALQAVIPEAAGMNRGAANPLITQGDLGRLGISHPPIPEQRAIAGVLGALDDKIEQNRRTTRVLERLARAIFQAWFVDFEPVKAKAAGATAFPSMPQHIFDALPTRFTDSAIGPVPKGWEVKAIDDVVTVRGGGTPSTKNPEYWDGGLHCWATPKDMSRLAHPVLLGTERHITDSGVYSISSGILPMGTVLMSSRAPVGYLAISGVPTAINQGFIAMVCDGPLPSTYVLNWAFTSMDVIKAHASGTTFPEISKKNFRPLPVVLPTDDVISAYQQLTYPLFELLTACVEENERLAQLRDYLLPKLLSGNVKVEA